MNLETTRYNLSFWETETQQLETKIKFFSHLKKKFST